LFPRMKIDSRFLSCVVVAVVSRLDHDVIKPINLSLDKRNAFSALFLNTTN